MLISSFRNAVLFIPQALSPSFPGLVVARWSVSHLGCLGDTSAYATEARDGELTVTPWSAILLRSCSTRMTEEQR